MLPQNNVSVVSGMTILMSNVSIDYDGELLLKSDLRFFSRVHKQRLV